MSSVIGPAPSSEVRTHTTRFVSIDIFRGLTMTLMIYVNELAGVKGLPWWNYHAPAQVDVMTYVDMVFPAFLFILGMTIPVALDGRLEKNDGSIMRVLLHVFQRTVALVVLGLILANADLGSRRLMGIDSRVWAILALIGAVLFWTVYKRSSQYETLFRVLRFAGLALMILMFAVFRRTGADGHSAWIDTSYPEILGLLGWTYLGVSILYLATRRWRWASVTWFILLMALCIASTGRWIFFPTKLPLYIWPFGNGAMAAIAMAGVISSKIFVADRGVHKPTFRQKAITGAVVGVTMILCGWFLSPLGISKIRATPTWSLYSTGCSILLFTLLYWICDVKRATGWARFVRPAGENTLLTYLLPDFYFFIDAASGFTYFATHLNSGLPGALRCAFFTALILLLSAVLTKWKVRLHI